jgi:hypothetical protein
LVVWEGIDNSITPSFRRRVDVVVIERVDSQVQTQTLEVHHASGMNGMAICPIEDGRCQEDAPNNEANAYHQKNP